MKKKDMPVWATAWREERPASAQQAAVLWDRDKGAPRAALLARCVKTAQKLVSACAAQDSLQEPSCSMGSDPHVTLLLALRKQGLLSLHPLPSSLLPEESSSAWPN